tara:strand:+ start:1042 stop:1566 length:525 start_codon:yes stop_codon:yes gene_type:complete
MEQDAQVEQTAQTVETGTVQDNADSSAENVFLADAKKYRKRAQEAENKLNELQAKLNEQEEAKLQKNSEWQELANKYKSERDEYKTLADEGQQIKESVRKDLLDQLSDEDKEFAIDLDTDKLQKFVSRSFKQTVKTNESSSSPMPDRNVNPFTQMDKNERRSNWSKVLSNYAKK